jgi:hypothetical protein
MLFESRTHLYEFFPTLQVFSKNSKVINVLSLSKDLN